MSKTRETFRRAIDRGAPSKREARADLDAVLSRIDRANKPLVMRVVPIASGAAFAIAAAASIVVYASRAQPPVHRSSPPAPTSAPIEASAPALDDHEMSIYLRRSDDPEDRALSLTFNVRGDRQ
jgi:hypothetical protein